jgi:predicted XRE-type DNA-binding protein
MKMRRGIMIATTNKVGAWDITQREVARQLGITQPRVNDLLAGKFSTSSRIHRGQLAPHFRRTRSATSCR